MVNGSISIILKHGPSRSLRTGPYHRVSSYKETIPIKSLSVSTIAPLRLDSRHHNNAAHQNGPLFFRRGPRTHHDIPFVDPNLDNVSQDCLSTHALKDTRRPQGPQLFVQWPQWPLPPPTCIPCRPRRRRPRLCCRTGCQCIRITTSQQWQQRWVRTQRRTQRKSRELMHYQAVSENT